MTPYFDQLIYADSIIPLLFAPTDDDDFISTSSNFIASSSSACLQIGILDDEDLESCETFSVAIMPVSDPEVNVIFSSAVTVTINDDEG